MESPAAPNPSQNLPHRIFVISDLHLGGEYPPDHQAGRGFRICTQAARLADFIRQVAQIDRAKSICELVINGDFLDFLAEKLDNKLEWQPFISDGKCAEKQLSEMIKRDRIVFDAMKDLLAAGHRLTILLGNHDVELSLPSVRQVFERELETDGKHFRYIFDNQAYVIGPVIIEHGNRYDSWNMIDHDGLRRTRSAQSRKEGLAEDRALTPPPGSIMVAKIMNQIKGLFPFVDLLKPENEATVPLLLTLEPRYLNNLMKLSELAIKAELNLPNSDGQPRRKEHIKANDLPEDRLVHLLAKHVSKEDVDEFYKLIEREALPVPGETQGNIAFNPEKLSKAVDYARALLPIAIAAPLFPLADRMPALLTALRILKGERTFNRAEEDDKYLNPARNLIGRGFKVVVFGHTHLAKSINVTIEDKGTKGIYLNTGTWADLMQLQYDQLGKERKLALEWLSGFVDDMGKGNIEPYILKMPTYARIELDNKGAILHADIYDFVEGQPII